MGRLFFPLTLDIEAEDVVEDAIALLFCVTYVADKYLVRLGAIVGVFCNMAPATAKSSANSIVKNPLFGFLPRGVTAKQVLPVMASPSPCPHHLPLPHTLMLQTGEVNTFNKTSFSDSYKNILDSRKKLPVFSQMHEFYEMVGTQTVFEYSEEFQSSSRLTFSTQIIKSLSWLARPVQEKLPSMAPPSRFLNRR